MTTSSTVDEFDLDFEDEAPSSVLPVPKKSAYLSPALDTGSDTVKPAFKSFASIPAPAAPAATAAASFNQPSRTAADPHEFNLTSSNPYTATQEQGAAAFEGPVHAVPAVDNQTEREPSPVEFEGGGLADLGSSKAQLGDDDFEYAFEGGKRAGPQLAFKPKPLPAHLVTDVRQQQLGIVAEDDEAEGEDDEEQDAKPQVKPQKHEQPAFTRDSDDEELEAQRVAFDSAASQQTPASMPAVTAVIAPASPSSSPATPSADSASRLTTPGNNTATAVGQRFVPTPVASPSSVLSNRPATVEKLEAATSGAAGPTTIPSPRSTYTAYTPSASTGRPAPLVSPRSGGGARPGALASARAAAAAAAARSAGGAATSSTSTGSAVGDKAHQRSPYQQPAPASADKALSGLILDEEQLQLTIPTSEPSSPMQRPEDLEQEFEAVTKERLAQLDGKKSSQARADTMSYQEAARHFMSCPVDAQLGPVQAALELENQERTWLQKLMCWAMPRHPPRQSQLYDQMVRLLCLAKMQLSDSDPAHFKLLGSLFLAFTGYETMPSRYGSHWADVGFQGQDPGTDLRSSGMLGLLQLYFLHSHHPANAQAMYTLARSVDQEFPLSIVSLNVTKWTIQAMRSGLLLQEAHRRQNMADAANLFYVGTFYSFYQRWLTGHCTMRESGFILKEIEERCKKRVNEMFRMANTTLTPP